MHPLLYVPEVHVKATPQPDHHLELTTRDMASVLDEKPTNQRKVSSWVTVVLVASVWRPPGFRPRWKPGGTRRHGSTKKWTHHFWNEKLDILHIFWAMSLILKKQHNWVVYSTYSTWKSGISFSLVTSFTFFFLQKFIYHHPRRIHLLQKPPGWIQLRVFLWIGERKGGANFWPKEDIHMWDFWKIPGLLRGFVRDEILASYIGIYNEPT